MYRDLNPAELAQIAGRAGRHMEDGTFGVTGEARPPESDVVNQMEDHRFQPVRIFQWRNRLLNFSSLDDLMQSLLVLPRTKGLTRAMGGDDVLALEMMMREPEIQDMTTSEDAVKLLWDVCQIPDYRNTTSGEHGRIVENVFRSLMSSEARIQEDWFQRQLSYAENTDGDIDTLASRIAHVRTWTFIANRPDWLEDPYRWQQKAKDIEDRLSDALHERLTQRFIDRRTSVLMKRMREKEKLMASVSSDGDIHVEGEFIGQMTGFRFVPDESADDSQAKALKSASLKAIAEEMTARARACSAAPGKEFGLGRHGAINWGGAKVGWLEAGQDILKPRVQLLANDQLEGADRAAVLSRLEKFVSDRIATILEPLVNLASAEDVAGLARGLAFRLTENLGILARDEVAGEVKSLDQAARGTLRPYGIRFGAYHIFLPALLKPAAAELKLLLWALWQSTNQEKGRTLDVEKLPEPPGQGLTSVAFDRKTPFGFYRSVGYRICGTRAVRIDMLERLADLIRPCVYWRPLKEGDERPAGSIEGGGFTVTPDMMSLVGCSGEDFGSILKGLGYRLERRKIEKADEATKEEAQPPETASTKVEPGDAVTAPAGAEGQAPGPATDEPASEPEFLEIWWPGGKRQSGRRADQQRQKSPPRRDGQQQRKKGRSQQPRQKAQKSAPKRVEKPIDVNSPFAALSALKAELEKKGPA